jgi:CheY-like chemotaxis protein
MAPFEGPWISTVLRAYGGQEAIDIARRELPDVMVIDLMMPVVNGFDVVAALKDHPDTARIPILVVTAKRITDEDRAKLSGYVTTMRLPILGRLSPKGATRYPERAASDPR